jgi:LAO/AO transport system kinase
MNVNELIHGVENSNLRALAKSITLIESTKSEDKQKAKYLLSKLKPQKKSIRIGITGVPGVGKSTFIESLGLHIISLNKKIAVLAIDPTSPITGGSILGDKTRMSTLSMKAEAFIRPTPSSGTLGGVAKKTRDTIFLCEAFGFDVILIETVGVGQSEISVEGMTDFFILLLLANAGDELQGIKKGIMEMADLILINKADGNQFVQAKNARTEFENAIKLFQPKNKNWNRKVLTISSIEKTGIEFVWEEIEKFKQTQNEYIESKRDLQNENWIWGNLKSELEEKINELKNDIEVIKIIQNKKISSIEKEIKLKEIYLRNLN